MPIFGKGVDTIAGVAVNDVYVMGAWGKSAGAVADRVHGASAYAGRGGRRLPNASDGLYRHGGRELLLAPQPADGGYTARFAVGLTG